MAQMPLAGGSCGSAASASPPETAVRGILADDAGLPRDECQLAMSFVSGFARTRSRTTSGESDTVGSAESHCASCELVEMCESGSGKLALTTSLDPAIFVLLTLGKSYFGTRCLPTLHHEKRTAQVFWKAIVSAISNFHRMGISPGLRETWSP